MVEPSSSLVVAWWSALCGLAALNLGLLWLSHRRVCRAPEAEPSGVVRYRRRQLALCAVYVLGCGFRSVLPRSDLHRVVMVDAWPSAIVLGRSAATLAELSFVAQWVVLLRELARHTGRAPIARLSAGLLPMIALAQACSWYAVLTRNPLGSAVEESLWAAAAALTITGYALALPSYRGRALAFLTAGAALGAAYVGFMVTVDVPNYVAAYREAEAAGAAYRSLYQGLVEVTTTWTVDRSYEAWRYAMVWMSGYFSLAVWVSLCLVHAPRFDTPLRAPALRDGCG